jgi:metal-sulfur cluster biosynthetic enzyme
MIRGPRVASADGAGARSGSRDDAGPAGLGVVLPRGRPAAPAPAIDPRSTGSRPESAAGDDRHARALRALGDVLDPEWPVSIVDLGLVRGVEIEGGVARVRLTLTSTACPCADWIQDDVRRRLLAEPGIDAVEVELTWERWSRADMTDTARRTLAGWGVVP